MKKALAILAVVVTSAASSHAAIVINEVYGGGGNSGAPFQNDFVELFNNGATAVDIGGYGIQYASATGAFGANNFALIPVGTMLAAGDFYTETGASNAAVGAIVPADQAGGNIAMSATTGKVRLLDAALNVVDLVGYGTATTFEGAGPAAAPSATTSDQRIPNGVDSNDNLADFKASGPTPDALNSFTAVPEPATWMLMGVGLLLGVSKRLRRKS